MDFIVTRAIDHDFYVNHWTGVVEHDGHPVSSVSSQIHPEHRVSPLATYEEALEAAKSVQPSRRPGQDIFILQDWNRCESDLDEPCYWVSLARTGTFNAAGPLRSRII